jgi:hypothetical protein
MKLYKKVQEKPKLLGEGKLKHDNYLQQERDENSGRNGFILIAVCHKAS